MSELEQLQLGSLTVLALAFSLSLFGIIKLSRPANQVLVLIVGAPVVFVIGWFTWFTLIYVQTVPVERMLREYFGFYLSDHRVWYVGGLYYFGPPLLLVLVMIGVFSYTCWSRRRKRALKRSTN